MVLKLKQIEKDKAYEAGREITENQQWYQNKGPYPRKKAEFSNFLETTSLSYVPETAPEGK